MSVPRPEGGSGVAPYLPLPAGLANPPAGAAGVFDRVASLYDRARPGYPPEAVSDLLKACAVGGSSRILEIGCGTGQLTRDLAPTGARIVCLEPGHSLARIARTNLAGWPNVEVRPTTFEDLEDRVSGYDTLVSATAFHWVDPHISFTKAAALLEPGGHLALVTNIHSHGGTHTDEQIAEPVRALHRRLAPEVGDWNFPSAQEIHGRATAGGDITAVWARVERKAFMPPTVGHLFGPPTVQTYPWLATYDTSGYLAMLATQSSYALLEPGRRAELLESISALIDEQLGGTITKEYVTVVAVAARRQLSVTETVVVAVDDPRREDVRFLLETHLAFSRSATPAGFSFALDADRLREPSVTFFSARAEGELLGVAALRHLDPGHVELKSMHTRQDLRRQGIAEQLVKALVVAAAEGGYRRMSLETGTNDAFAPARALYRKLGFRPCGPFADYADTAHNTFMTITIDTPEPSGGAWGSAAEFGP